jgi:hypothetical protein
MQALIPQILAPFARSQNGSYKTIKSQILNRLNLGTQVKISISRRLCSGGGGGNGGGGGGGGGGRGKGMGRHYPHPPGLPIRRKCRKVHRDFSDGISPIVATYVPHVGCSIYNWG